MWRLEKVSPRRFAEDISNSVEGIDEKSKLPNRDVDDKGELGDFKEGRGSLFSSPICLTPFTNLGFSMSGGRVEGEEGKVPMITGSSSRIEVRSTFLPCRLSFIIIIIAIIGIPDEAIALSDPSKSARTSI
jgi:hypothetical protein